MTEAGAAGLCGRARAKGVLAGGDDCPGRRRKARKTVAFGRFAAEGALGSAPDDAVVPIREKPAKNDRKGRIKQA